MPSDSVLFQIQYETVHPERKGWFDPNVLYHMFPLKGFQIGGWNHSKDGKVGVSPAHPWANFIHFFHWGSRIFSS